MTLTLELVTCFLFATHCLVMMIICVTLISNLTMHDKVTGQTQTGFTEAYARSFSADCDLHLWPSDTVLMCNTSFCIDNHLCWVIFKSHHAWQRYWPDTNRFYWSICTKFKSRLPLWPMTLFATHHFVIMIIYARLFTNPNRLDKVIGQTLTGFADVYAQSF